MHDGVIWFDTMGCSGTAGRIGHANAMNLSPVPQGDWLTGWYKTVGSAPTATIYDAKNQSTGNTRNDAWDTDIQKIWGQIKVADEDLYKDWLKSLLDYYEDCDIDC